MSLLQLRRWLSVVKAAALYQPKDPDLDAVAASGVAAAWTAYTPTVTAGTGTFTTVSATGRYLVIGKLTCIQVTITITTNGTAATYILATLPNTSAGIYGLVGRENIISGKMLMGMTNIANATTVQIRNYDNSYPGASGATLVVSGTYENT